MPKLEHPVVDDAATIQWKGPLAGIDHTVLRVPDLDAAVPWYQKLLGLAVIERKPSRAYLGSPVTGRIVLGLAAGGTGLDYVSFRARSGDAFDAIGARLDADGVAVEQSQNSTRANAADALRLILPTGHRLEVLLIDDEAPAAPVDGEYRPGAIDVRPSHIQLRTPDVKGLTDFLGVTGFRSSSYVPLPDGDGFYIQFLRANEFHHQIAVLTGEPGLHHVAVEVDEVSFWQMLDNLAVVQLPAEYGPLRHHEGNMLSFYVRDPFGNRIEVASTMDVVGFDYPATTDDLPPWYHMNMWGPQPPESWETEWM